MGKLAQSVLLLGIGMFEVWLCYQMLFGVVVEEKALRIKDKIVLGSSMILLGYSLMVNRRACFFSHWMFLFEVVLLAVSAWFVVQRTLGMIVNLVLLYCSFLALIDFFCTFISVMFLGESFRYKVYLYPDSFWQIVIYICARGLLAGIIFETKRRWDSQIEIREYGRILLVINIALLVVLRQYQYDMVNMVLGDRILREKELSLSLLGSVSVIAVLGSLILKNKMIQKENNVIRLREELLLQKYAQLEKEIEQNRCQVHDMKHDLIVLKGYVKKGDLVSLENYLDKMEEGFFAPEHEIWMQNQLWNLVFLQKKTEAEKMGIELSIQMSSNLTYPFENRDGCILFGNLLDNAIEACEKIREEKKWIRVKIEKQRHLLFMEIANSISEKPKYKEGRMVTTKRQPALHGYGLKSVRRIVDKYGGMMAYRVQRNAFIMELTFFESDGGEEMSPCEKSDMNF